MANKKSEPEPEPEVREVTLGWPVFPDREVPLVTSVLSQHGEDAFYIAFAQAHPPFVQGMSRDEFREMEVPVRVVARMAVTPRRLREILDTLEANYSRWAERFGPGKEERGG